MDYLQLSVRKLVALIRGGINRILVGDILQYESSRPSGDFGPLDIPPLEVINSLFNGSVPVIVSVPSGSPYPMTVDMTDPIYANVPLAPIFQMEILNDVFDLATEATPISDCKITKTYTDDTRTLLSTLTIWAHPADALDVTIDELQLLMR